jgi:hypothetical protein
MQLNVTNRDVPWNLKLQPLKKNTRDLIDFLRGATIVGVKWIYKTKLNEHGEVDKIQGSPCHQMVHVTT